MTHASTSQFLEERRRTRRFFNRVSPIYPFVERHLLPEYRRALERIGSPRTTQHSVPAGGQPLPGQDLHLLDRIESFCHVYPFT